MKLLREKLKSIDTDIKKRKPLIHHITNYVTSGDCANMALAFGASPVMADALEEIEEITGASDALVLNLGTINKNKFISMLAAAKVAKMRGIPIVLDPVGVMASQMRLNMAQELINNGVQIIRGNYAECRALLGDKNFGQGVDAGNACDDKGEFARQAAQKFNCVVAITGAIDTISDGRQVILAHNGHELLTKVTGAGCMTTTLIACGAAVSDDYLSTAVLGITAINIAAQKAAAKLQAGEYSGTFKAKLLDAICNLQGIIIAREFKGESI